MKRVIAQFQVDYEWLNYLESINYEVEGLRVLNCQIVKSGKPDTAQYRYLLDKYLDKTKEYRVAFNEIIKLVVPPEYLGSNYKYEVNFMTSVITIYDASYGGACSELV